MRRDFPLTERNLEQVRKMNKKHYKVKNLFDADKYYKLGQNLPLMSEEEDPDESIYNNFLSSSMKNYEEEPQSEHKSSFVLLESSNKLYKGKNILDIRKKINLLTS